MLSLDLTRLESAERFQSMCFRLARAAFPHAFPINFASWDQGSDVVAFHELDKNLKSKGDIVWQCKFTKSLESSTKKAIVESLETLDAFYFTPRKLDRRQRAARSLLERGRGKVEKSKVSKWILCVPLSATRKFHDWLRPHMARRKLKYEVWDKTELLLRLEKRPDIVDAYFYSVYEELRSYFATEELQLVRQTLDKRCQWKQADRKVLFLARSGNVISPDLVFDIIVRNVGRVDTIITAIEAEVAESLLDLHGIPGDGLLFPQITYRVSINQGRPGRYVEECEPPLVIKAGSVERFKVRLVDTGYSWRGPVRLSLSYGREKVLPLPWWWLAT